ncbi:MAG: NAD-dependent epimerase/dehydratase family protein [Polyangiaceae bacterium]|jgi:dihydroflavonol-4-reductase
MKALVTGATGFLGSHLVRSLQASGHQIVPFSRSTGGDVLDAGRVREAAEGCGGAFHCAGKVSRDPADAEMLYRLHVEGTKTVLDACRAAGVKRVVVASSSGTVAVSDDGDHVGTEDDPAPLGIIGRWPYYRSKLFAERAALERNGSGLEVVCVNPALLLGPGDLRGSSTEDVRLLLEGGVPAVPAGGLSFVDVRDAAEAMRLAMERGRPGDRYLIGACNMTVGDFIARIARISGVNAPWLQLPRSRAIAREGAALLDRAAAKIGLRAGVDPVSVEMAQSFWYVDSSKATRELGWIARDPNTTLYDTVEDLRTRGVVWPRDAKRTGEGLSSRGSRPSQS